MRQARINAEIKKDEERQEFEQRKMFFLAKEEGKTDKRRAKRQKQKVWMYLIHK